MALRSMNRPNLAVLGLVVAGSLAVSAGGALAQYYDPYDDAYPGAYGYRYSDAYDGYYGRRMVPPRAVNRIAARDFGLVRIDRTIRTGTSHVVDGTAVDGSRVRLIFDARNGAFLDRIVLKPATPRQRVARIDPQDDKPVKRLVPRPPERPAALKPPAQATAPATIVPPSPAAPPRPEPEPASPAAPTEASAPATTIPASPAAPAAPAAPTGAGTGDAAETEPKKPRVVYPSPIPEPVQAERPAPVARAQEPTIPVPPVVDLPPVQIQDLAPTEPKPETPAVPVTPMD